MEMQASVLSIITSFEKHGKFIFDRNGAVHIWTDGGALLNGQEESLSAYSIWFGEDS